MNVADVMTRDVATVPSETLLKEVAALLAERGISGLPVVDDDQRVLGVVSEGDIVAKERGADRRPSLLGWLGSGDDLRLEARTAGEAMTSPVATIGPQAQLAEAARLMLEQGVNRLPVVDADGRLAGIVTRADLVRAFARPDEEIERELREDVLLRALWIPPERVQISVRDGEVELTGEVDSKADAELLEHFATRVPGVVRVRSDLRTLAG